MKDYKLKILFSDGGNLKENTTAASEEEVFDDFLPRTEEEWFKSSNGARTKYRNPHSVIGVEIKDVEEDERLTRERTAKSRESLKDFL